MKLSIITINYNNARGLEKTILSVINQTFKNIEYIIIDGGSNDESMDIISKYNDSITYWVSEPDSGIYNAMNKGIAKSSGDYCLFLNSGDSLLNKKSLNKCISKVSTWSDLISFDLVFDSSISSRYCRIPDTISFEFFYSTSLPHPSTFIRRFLFKDNFYDESYKIIADKTFFYDLFLNRRVTFCHVNYPLSLFDMQGVSNSNGDVTLKEWKRHLTKRLPAFEADYLIQRYPYGFDARTSLMSPYMKSLLLIVIRASKKIDNIISYLLYLIR